MSKLWGGRFDKPTSEIVRQFNDSLPFDQRLANEDIVGSQAWAKALGRAGVLTVDEVGTLVAGLAQVQAELGQGAFVFAAGDEDIHTAVERRLTELVGPVGGKLHTGRSRNDQVATDFRLWCFNAHRHLETNLAAYQHSLINHAEKYLNIPLPGFTHLQHAQPITWGHYILSHYWPIVRDVERLGQWRTRLAALPLGSGALAGTGYPIDRIDLAKNLGFDSVILNSIDAVRDRDFAVEFLFIAALLGVHLSQLAEQLIIYSSQQFAFVTIDDAYSTGSSLMPQKKNPDTLELTRGKAGGLIGRLVGLLTTLKGLPSTYDKDLQEDKQPVFEAFDTLMVVLPVMEGVINTLTIHPERMLQWLEPNLLATDLADYLVQKQGVPFRQAHELVGQCVRAAEQQGLLLSALPAETLQTIHPNLTPAVMAKVFDISAALGRRTAIGGTSPTALTIQLQAAKRAALVADG